MFQNMTDKQKKVLSWLFFLFLILLVGFSSYYFLNKKSVNYRFDYCLQNFEQNYSSYGLIYEYEDSCKEMFSQVKNLYYCDSIVDKDFCLYSFANFIENKSVSDDICSGISDSTLKKNFVCNSLID